MSFGTAIRSVLSQYATFSGRARRSEYWWWSLACNLVVLALYVLALVLVGGSAAMRDPSSTDLGAGGVAGLAVLGLLGVVSLGLILPSLAVLVRRLHDTGRSGWWYFISLVPFGGIVLLVFEVMDSTPGANEHGPNPKGVDGPGAAYGYGAPAAYGAPVAYGAPAGYGQQQPAYGQQPGYSGQQAPQPAPDPRFGTPPQG